MLRSQKMSADEFKGIRFSDGEQKVYQNYLPATGKDMTRLMRVIL